MTPDKRKLRTRGFSFGLVFLFLACAEVVPAPFASGGEKGMRGGHEIPRFYIVNMVVSDASPFRFNYILDVRAQDTTTVVTCIRIAAEGALCPGTKTVKAIQSQLPGTSLRGLTKHLDLCSIKEKDVESAIAAAKPERQENIMDSVKYGIVAHCSQNDRLFRLPFREQVDMKVLKAKTPKIAALYDLERNIARRAFGDRDLFYNIPAAQNDKLRRFGATLVPELSKGVYDLGFADNEDRASCVGKSPCDLGVTRDLMGGGRRP